MNNKILYLIIILVFFSFRSFSKSNFENNEYFVSRFSKLIISNDKIKYFEDGPDGFNLFFDEKYLIKKNEEYLILSSQIHSFIVFHLNETIFLYDQKSDLNIIGTDLSYPGFRGSLEHSLFLFNNYSTSSYLIEGKKEYKGQNLSNYNLTSAWVEGVENDGVGESISFDFFDFTNNIIIVNGFFNPTKLHLFKDNNRIKKIKITIIDQNQIIINELKDNYNLQMIKLPIKGKKFKIEILEVYKGEKYRDTCLSGLFTNYYLSLQENAEKLE